MTTLYIGAIGTLVFLIPTIFSFLNKRFKKLISFWKYPLFIVPLLVFAWILSTKLYIPFKTNGCSYAENESLLQSESFSANKKSGILMFYLDGFKDCRVFISMKNGKNYEASSLNSVFALVLPADSGQINSILVGKDSLPSGMTFTIHPGKLTYLGTIIAPTGVVMFIPSMACNAADMTFKAPTSVHRDILKDWAKSDRLRVTPIIKERLTQLQNNYRATSQLVGIQFGYLPLISTSLKGVVKQMTPDEVIKEYKDYEFMVKK